MTLFTLWINPTFAHPNRADHRIEVELSDHPEIDHSCWAENGKQVRQVTCTCESPPLNLRPPFCLKCIGNFLIVCRCRYYLTYFSCKQWTIGHAYYLGQNVYQQKSWGESAPPWRISVSPSSFSPLTRLHPVVVVILLLFVTTLSEGLRLFLWQEIER